MHFEKTSACASTTGITGCSTTRRAWFLSRATILRVVQSFEIRIGDEVHARLPGLTCSLAPVHRRAHRAANRKIEPLRDRVLADARERIQAAMDVRRLPTLAAFSRAFPELVRSTRKPWLDELFRIVSRRDPFPVVNDAIDAARLLALHYAVPISVLDWRRSRRRSSSGSRLRARAQGA